MKITNLEKSVGNFKLEIEHLDIKQGMIHGIIGHNGCGKSVLLKLIMGIMEKDSGIIDYEGMSLNKVTLMNQRPYLLHDTVYNNVVYPLKIRGITPDEKKIDKLLDKVDMLPLKKQYARSLSSGERQKLSFLRAIVFEPEFIMMDETLSNLDPDSEQVIVDMIKEIQTIKPKTWVIVSHQLERHEGLCDVIHKMEKGKYCGIIKGRYN